MMLNLTTVHGFYQILHWNIQQRSLSHGALHRHQVLLAADRSLATVCPGLAEPNNLLVRILTDQCLKFAICCNAPTPNNLQDFDPYHLAASFPVQWTLAHGSAGKRQRSVNGVPVLRPVECKEYLATAVKINCYFVTNLFSVLFLLQNVSLLTYLADCY